MTEYKNTPTVVVVRVRVGHEKLLMIRRNLPDGKGKLALPGGYQMQGETWQEAGAREVFEETFVKLDPATLVLNDVITVPSGQNLLFCDAQIDDYVSVDDKVAQWHENDNDQPLHEYLGMTAEQYQQFLFETAEVLLIEEPVETAFPVHTEKVRNFFEGVLSGFL